MNQSMNNSMNHSMNHSMNQTNVQDYREKYLKYKAKYFSLKNNMMGGGGEDDKMTIMLFKADWCGHCVKFKPIWETLSKTYEKEFNFKTYDADKETKTFEKYKVSSFPTILVEHNNNIIPYEGDRTVDEMVNFFKELASQ
jgi:hypothetical protein